MRSADGWGSEKEISPGNPVVFDAAREIAEEFILNNGRGSAHRRW